MTAVDPVQSHRLDIDVGHVAPAGATTVAAEVFWAPARPPCGRIWFCLPGGGMSRKYFDLGVEGYSMARHLAGAGAGDVVVTVDHLGVGDSSTPHDGYGLTPEVVAAADSVAVEEVLRRARSGALAPGLAPIADPRPIGVGHSMGGLITVYQQAATRPYLAIAMLGSGGGGLLSALTPEERAFVSDADGFRSKRTELTATRFGRPLPVGRDGPSDYLVRVPIADDVRAAIVAARAAMLGVCGLTSMVPGVSAAEFGRVDVPVFIGVGDKDITGAPHALPANYPASPDVTVFVLSPAGHNHNVSPRRAVLWDRLAHWGEGATGGR